MPCHAMPCHAMPCHAMFQTVPVLSWAMPSHQGALCVCAGNIPWGELMGPQIKTELVERKNTLKVSEKVKNPFNVLLYYGLNSDPDERNLTVEQFRDIMSQIVMVTGPRSLTPCVCDRIMLETNGSDSRRIVVPCPVLSCDHIVDGCHTTLKCNTNAWSPNFCLSSIMI